MSNQILIFTLNGCDHCQTLKHRLTELTIEFIDIEISNNENLWNQVIQQTGFNILPTVFIKKENTDNGPVYIPGRDYKNEDEIIEIIKTYI